MILFFLRSNIFPLYKNLIKNYRYYSINNLLTNLSFNTSSPDLFDQSEKFIISTLNENFRWPMQRKIIVCISPPG